ncbi:MAG TPA: J domain-containing protein [Myxococcales bacterium]|nr:J domain-containing protein [Myxococcales bacterium]
MRYALRVGKEPLDDYYSLLGVAADAGAAQLRRVWRRLALRWHPDRAGPGATHIFQKISAAYAVLSDPAARAAYDRKRGASAGAHGAAPASAPAAAPRRRAPRVMLSRLSGPLNALLTCGIACRAPGGIIELLLDGGEAAQGGMIAISMRVKVGCGECVGGAASCFRCHGRGTTDELFSAWLAVPPGVADGTMLAPSEMLRGMVRPVYFRMRVRGAR